MKFTIEEKDIKEVISIANDYYGVNFSLVKARELIRKSSKLSKELLHGGLDTVGRSVLAHVIVQDVLENVPCKVDGGYNGKHWEWPLFGSSQEYKDTFDREFVKNAPKKGYKLLKCWDK
jgi:hypothetical protein